MMKRALLACVLAAAIVPLSMVPAGAATSCGFAVSEDNFQFTGASTLWDVPSNWDRGIVPGRVGQGHEEAQVCIPAGKTVNLNAGEQANIRRLVSNGVLNLNEGSKLFVNGDASHPSTAKVLKQEGSTLGGHGKLTITSSMIWRSLPGAAATQTTRNFTVSPPNFDDFGPPGAAGRTVIAAAATLAIDGRGVNLFDRRRIDNLGTTTLSGEAYVAADNGTTFTNIRTGSSIGKFNIANNGGWVDGWTSPPKIVNGGTITKTAGTGLSILDVSYVGVHNGYTGKIVVKSGTLQVWSDVNTVTVSPGATFGNAGCTDAFDPACEPVATTSDKQVESVKLPVIDGGVAAPVTIKELTAAPAPPTSSSTPIGQEVTITTGSAKASSAKPMLFTFIVDASLIPGGSLATDFAAFRDGVKLNACPAGSGTGAAVACTASRAFVTGGDLKVVVRTKANSKFAIRKLYLRN